MIPDLASVVRKRYRMQRTLRFAAIVLLVMGVVMLSFGLSEPARDLLRGESPSFSSVIRQVVDSTPFLIGALFLAVFSSPLARWTLPIPRSACPACAYRLADLTEPRCPECGVALPPDLLAPDARQRS